MEKLWNYLGMNKERELLLSKPSARDVLEAIMSLKEEQKLKCCYVLWMCWSERNRIREGEQGRDAVWLSHSIQIRMDEWKRQETKKVGGIGSIRLSKWERPEQNYIKVNCDTAYDVNTGNGGWGCVLRDADGDAISVYRGRVESLMSALHGELIASIHGVQAAADKGVGHVILEMDALEVVQAVYSDAFDLSAVIFLVGELCSLLEFNFISWHVPTSSLL
jgi:hypothetical protein